MTAPQTPRQVIGHAQDARPGSPVEAERVPSRRLHHSIANRWKVLRELLDVVNAGPSPAVNRLTGIADCRHRMALREQCLEQVPLGNRRVLVLVQEYDPVSGTHTCCHIGEAANEFKCQARLVGEIQQVAGLLLCPPFDDEHGEGAPRLRRCPHVRADLLQGCMRVEFCDECVVVLDERRRIDVEFAELIVKGQDIACEGDR